MPSANTLVRWVNENAFAPIVRARPCPTFGRPVHHRGGPRRLRPDTSPHTLRIPPHDGHPVLRSAAKSGFRFTLAVSSFRLRARLGFSIPSLFSGQRDVNPAFGYSAPHLSAGGTSTLLNNALLSAHYRPVRPRPPHRYSRLVVFCPCASPLASMAWFLQFRIKACVGLTPPIRRLPPAQSSGSWRACPRRQHHPWFRQLLIR